MGLPVSYTTATLMKLTLTSLGSMTSVKDFSLLHHAGHAEAYINAKISGRYSIPFTTQVPMLEALATDLAIYNVISSQISLRSKAGDHPWFQRFKRTLDVVDEIANGSMPLVDASGSIISGRSDIGEAFSNVMDFAPTTAEIPVNVQHVDPDKTDELLADRDLDN